jgi:periplasmic protein CpxP/Spy
MRLNRIWATAILTVALAALPATAQPPAGRGMHGGGPGVRGFGGFGGDPARMVDRLGTILELTESQKTAAKAIFDTAKTQSEPLQTQLRDAHLAVRTAVNNNRSDAEINSAATQVGNLTGQLAGIHAKAQRAFRALLTDAQKQKLDQLRPNRDANSGRSFRNRMRNAQG